MIVRSQAAPPADARAEGLAAASAEWVVFLDEEDVPEREFVETLVRAQAASGADVVTCGLSSGDGNGDGAEHLFSGEPGGLGVLSNDYGTAALLRRPLLDDVTIPGRPSAIRIGRSSLGSAQTARGSCRYHSHSSPRACSRAHSSVSRATVCSSSSISSTRFQNSIAPLRGWRRGSRPMRSGERRRL